MTSEEREAVVVAALEKLIRSCCHAYPGSAWQSAEYRLVGVGERDVEAARKVLSESPLHQHRWHEMPRHDWCVICHATQPVERSPALFAK